MTHKAEYYDLPTVTPHSRLRLHIQRHAYKRGAYKGAAPADTSRRGKCWFRVEDHGYWIDVVFHHTAILRAFDDGRVLLSADGYEASPTTRAAMQDALYLAGYRGWLTSKNLNGCRNTVLRLVGVRSDLGWADGITIASDHSVSGYAPLRAYRADREARKEWRAAAQEFKAVLPVLLAGVKAQGTRLHHPIVIGGIRDAVRNPNDWPALTRYLAYRAGYDADAAWAYLDKMVTIHMREAVAADEC